MAGTSPGRELAIETLIDIEPQGPFYRAARVLEEAVPYALSSRPNLITRSTIVDEAHALSKHEVDSVEKYNALYPPSKIESPSSMPQTNVDLLLRHFANLSGVSTNPATSPLISALRDVCGEQHSSDSHLFRTLLRNVMTHKAIGDEDDAVNLETLVANVCKLAMSGEENEEVLQGLLIASLSILTGSILNGEEEEPSGSLKTTTTRGEYLNPVMPSLQVGSVLCLLQCKDDSTSNFHLDADILSYLGKAASVYEERTEILKSRRRRAVTPTEEKNSADDDGGHVSPTVPVAPLTPTRTPPPPIAGGQDDSIPALQPGFRNSDPDDSDSTDDSDERYLPDEGVLRLPHIQDIVEDLAMQHDDSSSSSSDSEEDPQQFAIDDEEDDDDDDDEEEADDEDDDVEQDDMLREALALSLVDQGPLFEASQEAEMTGNDGEQQESAQEEEKEDGGGAADGDRVGSPPPLMTANAASSSSTEGDPEPPLPPLPPAPSHYPYEHLMKSLADLDRDRNEAKYTSVQEVQSPYLDPSDLSMFGAVPTAYALVHVLRYTISFMERRREVSKKGETPVRSAPGGMGSMLFETRLTPYANDERDERKQAGDYAVSVQLLVSTFLIMDTNRKRAIDNLRHSVAAEQRNLQGEDEEEEDSPLSAEDDPALAFAMNYVEADDYMEDSLPPSSDTTQSNTSESLENKGMRRKAAAAAHEAAARLKSLRKQTEAWRKRVKLLSECTLMSMKCLREYLRSTVSRWLKRSSLLNTSMRAEPSIVDFHEFLPSTMVSMLSDSLTALMMTGAYRSYASLLFGDDTSEMEDVFFPLRLYQEALVTWGECLPMLHPSGKGRYDVLTSVLEGYIVIATQVSSDLYSLDNPPTSDMEVQVHKLQVLCKRLSVSDLLNGLVARPACYSSDENETKLDLFVDEIDDAGGPTQFSKLVKLVFSSAAVCREEARDDVQRLYLALCHRCNVQVLLWDGLLSCSQADADGLVASSPAAAVSAADMIRVNPSPSNNLQFDPTKCSDSIAVLSNHADSPSSAGGPSAHQRASKVWGAVLSSSPYNPKTGVHSWAIRLDRCERGHVFVGVATAQASTRTYVGGDKFGWGAIGTQALWHDRRKIRGDYGATFRTGSTIVVTLDTDAGTLSFSSWKDSSGSSTSFSLDPSLRSGSSPTRRIAGGGKLEDWGVAFEGLPLDSRLYPAVGLYQRDDRVTLLSVESAGRSSGPDGGLVAELSGGRCYYPGVPNSILDAKADSHRIAYVKRHNDLLSWEGIIYAVDTLRSLSAWLSSPEGPSTSLLKSVLPSVAAALSLVPPSIPMLSQRFAVMTLHHLSQCIRELHMAVKECQPLFSVGLKQGKWIIRATGSASSSSSAECEEYAVDFLAILEEDGKPIGFHGSGVGTTGKSKDGLVSIMGAACGSAVHFVEEWTDGNEEEANSLDASISSCVVSAKTNFDGTRFEGTYRNVQYGTTGKIAGSLMPGSLPENNECSELTALVLKCEALLCLAQGHLASILSEDMAGDHVYTEKTAGSSDEWAGQCLTLKEWVSSPLLENGLVDPDFKALAQSLAALRALYSPLSEELSSVLEDDQFIKIDMNSIQEPEHPPGDLANLVEGADINFTVQSGGKGSLASLCPKEYSDSRKKLICALVRHGNLYSALASIEENDESAGGDLVSVWRVSLRIMEDGMRNVLSSSQDKIRKRQEICMDFCKRVDRSSDFLLKAVVDKDVSLSVVLSQAASFYASVGTVEDISYLERIMECSTKKALLRMYAFNEVGSVLRTLEECKHSGSEKLIAVECIAGALPRLMGRVWANLDHGRYDVKGRDDLGGYYLSQLSGATWSPVVCVRELASSMYRSLARILKQHVQDVAPSTSSLVLSILAANILTIRGSDIPTIISRSGILEDLPDIVALHRNEARARPMDSEADRENEDVIGEIRDIGCREVSRAVLRSAISMIHVMSFQLTQIVAEAPEANSSCESVKMLVVCFKLVFGELGIAIPLNEAIMHDESSKYETLLAKQDWEKWCRICLPGGYRQLSASANRPVLGKAGITFMMEHGLGWYSASCQQPASKQAARAESAVVSSERLITRSNYLSGPLRFACHQYISKWLDVVACVVKSPASLRLLTGDWKSTDVLLSAIGFSCVRDSDCTLTSCTVKNDTSTTLLPARYRARILRLLRDLLVSTVPSQVLVESLFKLVGVSKSHVSLVTDCDEYLATREVVSLLRYLYLPSFPTWRACVHTAISDRLNAAENCVASSDLHIGIRIFLGGPIGAPSRGAYVIMKPTAAAEAQASLSSKSHSSSAGTLPGVGVLPAHVAGNGTESVVSGLCRSEATAGIVSSVLVKNGACEVILISRQRLPPPPPTRNQYSGSKTLEGLRSSKKSLTVRALRSPLADVTLADEVPLVLEPSLKAESILLGIPVPSSLLDEGDDVKSKNPRVRDDETFVPLLALRSAIALMSNKEILETFLKADSSSDTFARILAFASDDDRDGRGVSRAKGALRSESLSELPKHEAHYSHLLSSLRELNVKISIIDKLPLEFWEKELANQVAARETDKVEKSKEYSGAEKGRVTAPPDAVSASEHPSTTGAPARDSGEEDGLIGTSNRAISQSTVSSNSTDDEEEGEAAAAAAAHMREAAIAQMAELGLPRAWSELALRRTGGTNIEAAVHFCLERGGDMERLLAEEHERERVMRRQSSGSPSSRRRVTRDNSNHLLRQLLEMGFPSRWCAEALAATGNNVDEALTWILTNGERLSAEDMGMVEDLEGNDAEAEEESGEEEEEEEEEEETSETRQAGSNDQVRSPSQQQDTAPTEGSTETDQADKVATAEAQEVEPIGWSGSVAPLRFISGRSIINSKNLSVSGLPSGGFSSVGTKGILLTSGKWYYEAILETAGCLQIGWSDGSFSGHSNADRGDGCGDGPSSWAYDGWRRYRWHASATEWGCRWKEGDVVGCLADLDDSTVSFTLNGQAEEIGMGLAFSGDGFRPCGGVYACVSFNRKEKLRLILGGECSEPFKHPPPQGYKGVGEAVLRAVEERDELLMKEKILHPLTAETTSDEMSMSKRFLCDFSDGEHGHELFAWQHRYYGSDASVHLGSSRQSKQPTETQTSNGGNFFSAEMAALTFVCSHVERAWKEAGKANDERLSSELEADPLILVSKLKDGYTKVAEKLRRDLHSESNGLCILYCRKLILHALVTLGLQFDLRYFIPRGDIRNEESELSAVKQLWSVFDTCVNLRSAGWIGEAGAMAVAAEALGLGISSTQSRQSSSDHRTGMLSVGEGDSAVLLPSAGMSHVLSSALIGSVYGQEATSSTLAACAEAAIGGSGALVFLQPSLQSVLSRSSAFQDLIVAVIRRSVRLLAVVEYAGDDSSLAENLEDDDLDGSTSSLQRSLRETQLEDELTTSEQPDARLTLFLTGLLLSKPVSISTERKEFVMQSLFEAWSVGLLSGSAPYRMVCALSAAGILNLFPHALVPTLDSFPTLSRYYGRLQSTVSRRVWAERAAVPVCSRYVQAMIDLVSSVRRALHLSQPKVPRTFCPEKIWVDAATPIPFNQMTPLTDSLCRNKPSSVDTSLEWDGGWLSSDAGWEVWTGSVECMPVDWKGKPPVRSPLRTLMDGGEGPPMLRVGCRVMRGLDWAEDGCGSSDGNEDGKNSYEEEREKREKEKRSEEVKDAGNDTQTASAQSEGTANDAAASGDADSTANLPVDESGEQPESETPERQTTQPEVSITQGTDTKKKKKRRKVPNLKLPVGTVLSIEPWKGMSAMARRVKWDLTGIEGLYRYGGDGGRYDISHVEVNEKSTRVRKRHPFPESAEQCAFRHGFGAGRTYSVLLRLCRRAEESLVDGEIEYYKQGILEWPDFGAGIRVDCILHPDGAVTIAEKELLYGSKDSGWEARFGQPSYVSGTVLVLTPVGSQDSQADIDARSSFLSVYEELLGSSSFTVSALRSRADGSKLRVTSEMRLLRGKKAVGDGVIDSLPFGQPQLPAPIRFDRDLHASSISLSRDARTVTCVAPDGRGTAFASVGFTKGVHYWEVKLEQADIGSIFVGIAEKPAPGGSGGSPFGHESQPRLNRWHGWGFVNFRATYTAGAERVYGAHCHAGDTVGVLLDCDAGRVSFFFDGLKYGEHILNDLGCAFENMSPFGFNADGCGSGGAGQGAPSGIEGGRGGRYPAQGSVRPRALWPVVGLRNPGDRVTLSAKWMTSGGLDGSTTLKNVLAVGELLSTYDDVVKKTSPGPAADMLPRWFIEEAFAEYERWQSGRWLRSASRGSGPYRMASVGLDVDLDTSLLACASACASLGLKRVLLSGDRVTVKRSAGRMLEMAEEAVILGTYQGRLFYRLVSQKSEGGSLTEGGGRAWFWDESEVVDDGIELINERIGLEIPLPTLDRFRCLSVGGLKVVYEGGAVVRSDLEIFDGSTNIGLIPVGSVIPRKDVLERRVNSCGVVRYRIRFGDNGSGWVSSWIRGGKEEAIVEPVHDESTEDNSVSNDLSSTSFATPYECAKVWYDEYRKIQPIARRTVQWKIDSLEEFKTLLSNGIIEGKSAAESDYLLVSAAGAIADVSERGDAVDCTFEDIAAPLVVAASSASGRAAASDIGVPEANETALAMLSTLNVSLPPPKALLARIAMLRALNRRARLALPWLSVRPSQEGNAIFGGLCGRGAVDRVGHYRQPEALDEWVQVPSIGSRMRAHRRLLFACVKRSLLESIMESTTTPTPLSHDEYELPREIRTVRINRLKAHRAMASTDVRTKRKHSVFSQLQSETRAWGGAALRRGFVAKGHGGQKRAFKVKLIGEGVNDYSGPYREAFTDAMHEVLDTEDNGHGALAVLDKTPNNVSEIGDNRELYMFSTGDRELVQANVSVGGALTKEEARLRDYFSSLTMKRDEVSREVEESLVFLGRLVGTACRHGIPVDLPLPLNTVWKSMAEEKTEQAECLQELDLLASRQVSKDKPLLLQWQQRMLNSFMDGLSNVFPDEILTLMTGEEIRDTFCGNSDVDVDLLRRVVEYEGYKEDDQVIQFFWDALREMTSEERKKFLQFVWARNRLPLKESAFDAPFKIQKDTASAGGSADAALPSASTCFFSLTLPEYSNKDILKQKLLFAIENVVTMESDYVTNDAEVSEGWRGL